MGRRTDKDHFHRLQGFQFDQVPSRNAESSAERLVLFVYTQMDLLALEDLQVKLLLDNQIRLPEWLSTKVLDDSPLWASYRSSKPELRSREVVQSKSSQVVLENRVLPGSRRKVQNVESTLSKAINPVTRDDGLNSKPGNEAGRKKSSPFWLTFEVAELYSRQTTAPKFCEALGTLVTNHPLLSPVAFVSHQTGPPLPLHKYASWRYISKAWNRYSPLARP